MRGMFTSRVTGVAVTAAQDFFEITAPATAAVVVHEVNIGQVSDVGDAQDEILAVTFTRGTGAVTAGSGGSTPAVNKTETGSGTAGTVVKANNTTQMAAGSGALLVLRNDHMNVRGGFSYLPTPETRIVLSPGEKLAVAISAPADSLTMGGTVTLEEIGG